MLTLKEIKDKKCPVCDAQIVMIEQERYHCNGHCFEAVKYACGCMLRYSPNFLRIEMERMCPKSMEYIEFTKKRKNAFLKLEKFLEKLDVDKDWKKSVVYLVNRD